MIVHIPAEERDLLRRLYAGAVVLARTDPAGAASHLELGLVWAESPPLDPRTGRVGELEPWALPLTSAYQHALVALRWWIERRSRTVAASQQLRREAADLQKRARGARETARRLRAARQEER